MAVKVGHGPARLGEARQVLAVEAGLGLARRVSAVGASQDGAGQGLAGLGMAVTARRGLARWGKSRRGRRIPVSQA